MLDRRGTNMDVKDYRKELIELGNFISSKEQIEDKIKQLEDESWELEKKIKNLKSKYDKEQSDVSGLEKMGFSKFFFEMINKYDKKMEKEKKEALAALAKYETAKNEYESVNSELDKMRVELLKIDSAKRKYDEKYLSYKEYLRGINSREADRILLLETRIEGFYGKRQNYIKALEYCELILALCTELKDNLKSAKFWNNIDMLVGRSYIVHMSKYDSLDNGQRKISEMQVYINKLRNIVSTFYDVPNYLRTSLNDNKFADCLFDNIVTDGDIDDKITTSVSEIDMVKSMVEQISVELKHEKEKVDENIITLENQRDELMNEQVS